MKHILSLGAGVQSSTMALMAAHGEITPMPDCAIFADTQAEPQSVYKWIQWLEEQLPFPVIHVGRQNVLENALTVRVSKKSGEKYLQARIPAFTKNPVGKKGTLWRQCTSFWKIEMIQKAASVHVLEGVTMWLGISTDEAHRQKDSLKPWIDHRYPLIDLGMSRNDCLNWMELKGYPEPPRSACYFCPFHSDAEWIRLKRDEPDDFARAVQFEKDLQISMGQIDRMESDVFLHDSRMPLDTVEFKHERQQKLFGNECTGFCGNTATGDATPSRGDTKLIKIARRRE